MPQSIPLWGVVAPDGEPIVGSLDYTQYGATYRYGAVSHIEPELRPSWWRGQQAKGYRVRPFILEEKTHG
jgi:hypothetical protein